jgi:hypothetical protein
MSGGAAAASCSRTYNQAGKASLACASHGKSATENIPSHVLRQIKEEIENA